VRQNKVKVKPPQYYVIEKAFYMQYFTSCKKLSYLKSGIDEGKYSTEVYTHKKKL